MAHKVAPEQPRSRRPWRGLGIALLVLLALLVAALGAGWGYAGSDGSLAATLRRVQRLLPEGQVLEADGVQGSLRRGGRIARLHWHGPTLAVDATDIAIGWQLRPLLARRVQLGEVQVARVTLTPRDGPKPPPSPPPTALALPVGVDVPFRITQLVWAGEPAATAENLAGRYTYAADEHRLRLDGVAIATAGYRARWQGQATLGARGALPLALALQGAVDTPAASGLPARSWAADLRADGSLGGADAARLQARATLAPTGPDAAANPMRADVRATLAPWAAQPVLAAEADVAALDLQALLPTLPRTALAGTVRAGPAAGGGWSLAADARNASPAPWDRGGLPVSSLKTDLLWRDPVLQIDALRVEAGGGTLTAQGRWARPEAGQPWSLQAVLDAVSPAALFSTLDGTQVAGRASARQAGDGAAFDVQVAALAGRPAGSTVGNRSAGSTATGGSPRTSRPGRAATLPRIDRIEATGRADATQLVLDTLRIDALEAKAAGSLAYAWRAGSGRADLDASAPGATLRVRGSLAPTAGTGTLRAEVADAARLADWLARIPGAPAAALPATAGRATLDARWDGGWQAAQARWLGRSPGGARDLALQATLDAPVLDLQLPQAGGAPRALQLRDTRITVDGTLAAATAELRGTATDGSQRGTLRATLAGGLAARSASGRVTALRVEYQDSPQPPGRAPWSVQADAPFTVAWQREGTAAWLLDVGAASASVAGPAPGTARVQWQPIAYRQAAGTGTAPAAHRLRSDGRIQGVPVAWAQAYADRLGGAADTVLDATGTLVLDGGWSVDAGDTLRARAELARASGDLRIRAGDAPAPVTRLETSGTGPQVGTPGAAAAVAQQAAGPVVTAGVRAAVLRLEADGEAVKASLRWDSERAGTADAQAATRLVRTGSGWAWPVDAPLDGRLSARLPSIGAWSLFAPPGWRVQGTLEADATVAGTRAAPRWQGTLAADRMAVRSVVDGVDLQDGRLRAQLRGDRLDITEFTLRGAAGSATRIAGFSGSRTVAARPPEGDSTAARQGGGVFRDARELRQEDGGRLTGRGSVGWSGPLTMDFDARLEQLRVLVRTDRQLALSGSAKATLQDGVFVLRGDLKADRAAFILPDETAPSLGSDVVVRSAASDRAAAEKAQKAGAAVARAETRRPPDIQVRFDLGDDFALQGRGITTRLAGRLDIASNRGLALPPRVTGEVRTVAGRYRAYGQQLDVETGVIRFNGAVDNPQLDILAIRPNIAQRAGVQVTGSAQAPRVRLYSDPDLPDAEKLAWVVLGRSAAGGGAEAAVLQQAALAFLSGKGKPGGGNFANRLGLDEIGFKGPGNGEDASSAALTFGKRLTQDFYVTYESSLSGALGTLYIFYDLTKRLTLRGQTGATSAVDLIYTISYD